jgi:broad specificity phosphatase PhoE
MSKTIDVYLIRHAESTYNAENNFLIGGQTNNIQLSDKGIRQALLLGQRLKEDKIIFDEIYSSSAERALNTAMIVSALVQFPLHKIKQSDKLLELDQGDWTGKRREQVYTPDIKSILDEDSWNFQPPNGESQKMVAERMYGFVLEKIVNDYTGNANKSVAVFSHGNAIKCFLKKIMEFNPKYIFRLSINNASITHLSYESTGDWKINVVGDTGHLRYNIQ